MTKEALIIFARNPRRGQVKTRLAASMGEDRALEIYRKLIQHTSSVTGMLPLDKFVFYSGEPCEKDAWDPDLFIKEAQQGKNLGERMCNALKLLFREGYQKLVLIGTDCPDINETILLNAFHALAEFDVAIGPAEDGGYYLIGMNTIHEELFDDISWSSSRVLGQTLSKLHSKGLSSFLLPRLRDVDDECDWMAFQYRTW